VKIGWEVGVEDLSPVLSLIDVCGHAGHRLQATGQRSSTQPRTANIVNSGTGSFPPGQTKRHSELRDFSKNPYGDGTTKIPCKMAQSWNQKIRSEPPLLGGKASRTTILREKIKMDTPAPVEGMNGTIFKIRTTRNAN